MLGPEYAPLVGKNLLDLLARFPGSTNPMQQPAEFAPSTKRRLVLGTEDAGAIVDDALQVLDRVLYVPGLAEPDREVVVGGDGVEVVGSEDPLGVEQELPGCAAFCTWSPRSASSSLPVPR
jgi:hypothetical protein